MVVRGAGKGPCASAPPGATLPGLAEWNPSEIPVAVAAAATTVPWVCGAGGMRLPLPRLSRHPFHGSPERVSCRLTISAARPNVVLLIRRTVRPSGIPVAVVCDHGAVVSTGFPSPDAGWVPAAPATWASGACHRLRVMVEPRWGERSEE